MNSSFQALASAQASFGKLVRQAIESSREFGDAASGDILN